MKLEEGVEFDRNTLKHWGFCTVGKFNGNSTTLKAEAGDHALVVLFQPFQGKWIQALGCFLVKGNCKGKELAKILLEGITLCEDANLHVDAIVSDGARWNRVMWSHFGVGEESSSCEHPSDKNRRLWFFSDWCHLLKCMRNIMCPLPPKQKKGKKRKNANEKESNKVDPDDPPTNDPNETEGEPEHMPHDKNHLNKELIVSDTVVLMLQFLQVFQIYT